MFQAYPADKQYNDHSEGQSKARKDTKKMEIKRSEPRFMCSEPVNILVNDGGRLSEGIANLEDISPSGACVHLEEAIQLGAQIEIICSTGSFKGTVRNCRYTVGGFDVGMQFVSAKSWNLERFKPKHLLLVATVVPEEVEVSMSAHSGGVAVEDYPEYD
jgi:hypothetical protein